jgi:hypothetical protein
VVHDILRVLLAVSPRADNETKAASSGQQNQDNCGINDRRTTIATAALIAYFTIDALEADLETKLGLVLSILQYPLRRVSSYRNHGNTRLVSVVVVVAVVVKVPLLGSHKGFDVVAGDEAADRNSTKTACKSRSYRGSGARHE